VSEHKPTLLQLREQYGFNTWEVANMAHVQPDDVYFMLVGRPVSREVALKVLKVVSFRAGIEYTLDTVDIPLLDEQGEADDVTTR